MQPGSRPLPPLRVPHVLLIVGVASALAVVFGVAAGGKVAPGAFADFRRSVGQLWPGRGRLSPSARHGLAVAVLVGEGLVTVALVAVVAAAVLSRDVRGWALLGFAGAATLMSAFTVGHAVALRRGRAVSCACFGRSTTTVGPLSLLRNVLLLALGVAGLGLAVAGGGAVSGVSVLPAVLAGSVLGLLLVNLEEIVNLLRPSPASSPPRRLT
jgi:hypothetical protein